MRIQFYDDPVLEPRSRDDVRFNQLGLYLYEDGRRVAVGFDITPFLEPPHIEVTVRNDTGQIASSLSVIEAVQANFNVTLHLRDEMPSKHYRVDASLYYSSPGEERLVVDRVSRMLDASRPGEQ